jgi:Holliday junction resolvase-like predicted endonuclease
VTVRHDVSLTKAQIIAALRDARRFFDDDLVEIGAGFACSPFGEIDLLGLDRERRLTVVEVQNALDDTLVARGLSHVDWVVRNVPTVRRLYPAWRIDTSRQPRLALVAPRFSLALRSGIRQITAPAMTCFRYCEVDLPGEIGIFVERL